MRDVEIRNIKGTTDYLPREKKIRDYITDVLKETFESFGYMPVDTPILCYYDVLASKYAGGAEILKEVYKLKDQGERDLALRYDLTVPFSKLISITKDLNMPFKRYEIGKVFRDGPVKIGRNREFIQCDADVVGVKDVYIDAELISLYVTAFNKLNIKMTVNYNNRKLMNGILKECDVAEDNRNAAITVIDKFKKLTQEEIREEFKNASLSDSQIDKLYQYFNLGFDKINELFANTENELLQEGLKELNEVRDYVRFIGIEDQTNIDLTLARGLDIYTGTIFEVFTTEKGLTSSIGGGGRYDKIITQFISDGNEYPASGISFGLDIIYEILKDREEFKEKSIMDVLIIPLNTKKETLKLANALRIEGIKVELIYNDRKLNKILNSADRDKIPFTIIIGEDEVAKNEITLKNMIEKETTTYNMDNAKEIAGKIKAYLNQN